MPARRYDHLRQHSAIYGNKRQRVIDHCHRLLDDIDEIDRQLADLSARRRRLVLELKRERRRLMPVLRRGRARQPVPDGTARLPSLHHAPVALWGRRLRGACIAVLRRAGPLALPELHALLHHHGFRVDSRHAAKSLSDAMSYEAEHGRAVRVERGVYAAVQGHSSPNGAPGGRLEHLPDTISPFAA